MRMLRAHVSISKKGRAIGRESERARARESERERGSSGGERRDRAPRVESLHRNVRQFRGGLVLYGASTLYLSTLGLRVIKKAGLCGGARMAGRVDIQKSLSSLLLIYVRLVVENVTEGIIDTGVPRS